MIRRVLGLSVGSFTTDDPVVVLRLRDEAL
jgi:hypothetical protein